MSQTIDNQRPAPSATFDQDLLHHSVLQVQEGFAILALLGGLYGTRSSYLDRHPGYLTMRLLAALAVLSVLKDYGVFELPVPCAMHDGEESVSKHSGCKQRKGWMRTERMLWEPNLNIV